MYKKMANKFYLIQFYIIEENQLFFAKSNNSTYIK